MSRNEKPEINAGSMADIAFLLLIFFLVTTTMDVDSGINRKIPKKEKIAQDFFIKKRNILEVDINSKNELFVDGNVIRLEDLQKIAINFIDNGGGLDLNQKPCSWCEGQGFETSSDHPSKAFISIKADRNTNYEMYISVLNTLNMAYTNLRNKLSLKLYQKDYETLLDDFKKANNRDKLIEAKILLIREKYPLLLSDAEIKN